MVVNTPDIPLEHSAFSFAAYDRAPAWLRRYLMHHPFEIHYAGMSTRYKNYTKEEAIAFLKNAMTADRLLVGAAAFETYGPDHPQAISPINTQGHNARG
jgi:hypothetical protein